ncbi:GDSL-type esterase/lipase family protein [uncultured Ruthenibacterium sp.]|uniref:GDSL-type esterase/lipase family protein n=1 Tax=uncultured Ruthenibacterium sp. TaxID=1905347 RepID=UPI00349EF259
MPRRVCTFAVAHTDISAQPFNNAARTVRILAPNNLVGDGIYVKFSNYYSSRPVWVGNATVALADRKGNLLAGTIRPLTVCGDTSFALVPERDVYSDRVSLSVRPGQTIAVSLYYPLSDKVSSGNFVSTFATRSVKGDYCAQEVLPKARLLSGLSRTMLPWDLTNAVTTLSEIVVEQDDDSPIPCVVAAFGDSIMQQGAWVTPFTQRLYRACPGMASVCNLGIGGNRLLYDSPSLVKGIYGHAGVERFRYDLLPVEGLTHAIFALGTNDIGLPGKDGAPESELITLEQYQDAVKPLVEVLHRRGVKVYAGKLLPREINHIYTSEREQLRLMINDWLETCGLFDAVLDLGAPIAATDGPGMKKEFSLPDGLHPNKLGGMAIAQNIDLRLFLSHPGGGKD